MQQDLTQGSITRHLLGSAAVAGVSAAGAVFFLARAELN
jgi:hypothetical protein